MDISARIAELEALKLGGQISQEEFDVLLSLAQNQNAQSSEQTDQKTSDNSESNTEQSSSNFSIKKALIAVAVIVLLVFAFISTRQGEPMDSKEYKALLQQKSELLATKTDLESKTGDVDKLQTEIDDYSERVELWKSLVSDVNSLGIEG
jgi:ATP-dependent Zn protease